MVQWLQGASGIAPDPPGNGTFDRTLSTCRHTLRGALGIVDYKTNLGFWQLSMNAHIQILSGVLLIALLAGMSIVVVFMDGHLFGPFDPIDWWQVLVFVLLGIAGATLANMLSKDPFTIVMGATARWYVYYLFVKPLIGGFAALFVFLVERSALLFEVTQKTATDKTLVQIHVTGDTQEFLVRAAFAIVAGVFADRVLSSTMESVFSRMFAKSEKSLGEVHTPAQSATVTNT